MKNLNRIIRTLVLFLIIFNSHKLYPQMQLLEIPDVKTEGNLYVQNSQLYTDVMVVNFIENVISLPQNQKYANINDINSQYTNVIQKFNELENQYGQIQFIKQVPGAQWGDTQKQHKITGQWIQTNEYSQLFSIKFQNPVPEDSIIISLTGLTEIEYVHQPVSLVYLDEPDDPYFSSEWHLEAINAENAWDIIKGNSDIKIAIVDDGVKQDHEDLMDNVIGGNQVEDVHGTWVSGVAAGCTNNGIGIASLSWNVSMYTYGGYSHVGAENYAVRGIISASENADIINMSWLTARWANLGDMLENCPDCPKPQKWVDWGTLICNDYPSIRNAISDAISLGVICIASAGNSSKNNDNPANCDPMFVPYVT
ncbi:MAG: S8 family serine peptidase, partial [Calditrichia bacterium]|nr:S8 family serine peptidase [Calditrichia bacterium]